MYCECLRSEWRHHHSSGGTYPCGGESCSICKPPVEPITFLAPDWPEDEDDE